MNWLIEEMSYGNKHFYFARMRRRLEDVQASWSRQDRSEKGEKKWDASLNM
jgi:hypothetical protein